MDYPFWISQHGHKTPTLLSHCALPSSSTWVKPPFTFSHSYPIEYLCFGFSNLMRVLFMHFFYASTIEKGIKDQKKGTSRESLFQILKYHSISVSFNILNCIQYINAILQISGMLIFLVSCLSNSFCESFSCLSCMFVFVFHNKFYPI